MDSSPRVDLTEVNYARLVLFVFITNIGVNCYPSLSEVMLLLELRLLLLK